MTKLWQRTMKGEKGQVLAGILILLAVGTLLIAPALNYAATSLNAGRIAEENMSGALAADAGVEDVLWSLMNGEALPTELSENVNQMQVEIDTVPMGTYTLFNGQLVVVGEPPQIHYDWLTADSEIVWVELAQAYRCEITVTRDPNVEATISLVELGIRLPPGYAYKTNSVLQFPDNLSEEEPVDTLDWTGEAHMLAWSWSGAGRPTLSKPPDDQIRFQTFYVTGEGEPEGYYAWVEANPNSVGQVGEFVGTLYGITATATRPGDGEITGRVTADVLLDEVTEEIHVMFWRTSPQ